MVLLPPWTFPAGSLAVPVHAVGSLTLPAAVLVAWVVLLGTVAPVVLVAARAPPDRRDPRRPAGDARTRPRAAACLARARRAARLGCRSPGRASSSPGSCSRRPPGRRPPRRHSPTSCSPVDEDETTPAPSRSGRGRVGSFDADTRGHAGSGSTRGEHMSTRDERWPLGTPIWVDLAHPRHRDDGSTSTRPCSGGTWSTPARDGQLPDVPAVQPRGRRRRSRPGFPHRAGLDDVPRRRTTPTRRAQRSARTAGPS
jgi:hypothetical protein